MNEELFDEIMEYADGLETEEELEELIEDMEKRWKIRKIDYSEIEVVIDVFREEYHI